MTPTTKIVAGGLVALVLVMAFASGTANAAEPPPIIAPPIDPAAVEADSCLFVVANRPIEWEDQRGADFLARKRTDSLYAGLTEASWLALVAYWRAYPAGNVVPTTPDEVAALGRLTTCVSGKLAGQPPPLPPLPTPPDTAALEAEACAWVVTAKPDRWGTKKRAELGEQLEDAAWFGLVAYWRSYPEAAEVPVTPDEQAALARLVSCITARLTPKPGPALPPDQPKQPPAGPQPVPEPSDDPTPGQYYQVKKGVDFSLFGLSSRAYGTKNGSQENLAATRHLNSHPYNHRFWKIFPEHENEPSLFPPEGARVDLSPAFGPRVLQWKDPEDGARGKGAYFPMIFIPPLED